MPSRGGGGQSRRRGQGRSNHRVLTATLKAELVEARGLPTRAAARLAIFEWLEVWYNRQRRHSALGYRAPVAYEEQLLLLQDLAA